jgi:NAD(P)-dependent dehydrogenase (short-subunit alcohol dehydrogenase family)
MERRTLVIGANPGNIGEAIVFHHLDWSRTMMPTIDELDVRSYTSIRKYLDRYPDVLFGEVVYSAGINNLGMIGSLSQVDVPGMFDVNVVGFIRVLDSIVEHNWLNHQWGDPTDSPENPCSIVAVVSDSAHTAMRGSIGYASSKAALAHAVRCAARELAPNYRVNGVSPSMVEDTPMTKDMDERIPTLRGWTLEKAREYEESLVPMGRRVTKREVAELVVSILDGPAFLTGSIVTLAGGK